MQFFKFTTRIPLKVINLWVNHTGKFTWIIESTCTVVVYMK